MREPAKQSDPSRRPLFDVDEKSAADLPPDLTPRQWSDAHRKLPPGGPAGNRWLNEHSPALAVLMDIIALAWVLEVWIKKCVQAGVSTMAQNIVGKYADLDPCTCLVVLSTKELGDRAIARDWRPMFRLCDPLKAKRTGRKADDKKLLVKLINGFELHLAYSGSVSSLAQLAAKLLVLDEVDKWEKFDGEEADPIDLARMRQTKFLDKGAKLIGLSTPTTSNGNIAKEVDACSIKIEYAVPCPHCGVYQVLHQSALRWPKPEQGELPNFHAERVLFSQSAWFDCVWCKDEHGQPTRIDESHKRAMVTAGRWQTPDESWCVYYDGRTEGQPPPGVKIGVKYPAFYDFDIGWSKIASETIEAGKDPAKLLKVTTQRYAEEFKFQEVAQSANLFAQRCRPDPETGFIPFPAGKLQPWVMRLLLTVDTQKNGFWWVIRGWGAGLRSHRVAHGQATSFEQIEDLLYQSRWPFIDGKRAALGVHRVGIDSGGGIQGADDGDRRAITETVYRWCEKDPVYRLALKGNNKPMDTLLRSKRGLFVPPDQKAQPFQRTFYLVDSAGVRDMLASHIAGKVSVVDKETGEVLDVDQWNLNDFDDFTYNQHLAAVKKTRKLRGKTPIIEWGAEDGARHDYHDCEAYQIALAIGWNLCVALPSVEQWEAENKAQRETQVPVGIRRPDGRKFLASRR